MGNKGQSLPGGESNGYERCATESKERWPGSQASTRSSRSPFSFAGRLSYHLLLLVRYWLRVAHRWPLLFAIKVPDSPFSRRQNEKTNSQQRVSLGRVYQTGRAISTRFSPAVTECRDTAMYNGNMWPFAIELGATLHFAHSRAHAALGGRYRGRNANSRPGRIGSPATRGSSYPGCHRRSPRIRSVIGGRRKNSSLLFVIRSPTQTGSLPLPRRKLSLVPHTSRIWHCPVYNVVGLERVPPSASVDC